MTGQEGLLGAAPRSARKSPDTQPMRDGPARERSASDGGQSSGVQGCGNLGVGHGVLGNRRLDDGGVFTGSGAGLFKVNGSGCSEVRVSEAHALCLLRRQCRLGSGADKAPLLFGQGRIEVKEERISVGDIAAGEGHAVGHKPSDEGYITGEAIELRDNDGGFQLPGRCQGRFQLRPPVECIGAPAGLNLQVFADDGDTVGLAVTGNDVPLGFEAEATASLLLCADAQIGNGPRLRCMCVGHVMIVLSVGRVRRRLYVRIGKDKLNRSTRR